MNAHSYVGPTMSVRCVRHSDGAVVVGQFQYGYGEHYRQTALIIMRDAGWLPEQYTEKNLYAYERENDYPILWNLSTGKKREVVENGRI